MTLELELISLDEVADLGRNWPSKQSLKGLREYLYPIGLSWICQRVRRRICRLALI